MARDLLSEEVRIVKGRDLLSGPSKMPPRDLLSIDLSSYAQEPQDEPFNFQVFTPQEETALKVKGKIGAMEAAIRQHTSDLIPFSPTEYIRNKSAEDSIKRLQANEYEDEGMRQKDKDTFITFMKKVREEQIREFTWGAKVYQGASQLPGIGIEFALTGGLLSLGKKAAVKAGIFSAKQAAISSAKQAAMSGVKQAVKAIPGLAVKAAARTPMMYNHYTARASERQIFANIAMTDKGVRILEESTEKPYVSFLKAYGSTAVEMFTEELGGPVFRPIAGSAGRLMAKSLPKKSVAGFVKLGKLLSVKGKITGAFKTAGFHGVPEEMTEEVAGGILRAAFKFEDFGEEGDNVFQRMYASIPSMDEFSVMAGVFSIPGAGSYAGQRISNKMRGRGFSKKQIEDVAEYATESEKEEVLKGFVGEENDAIQSALKDALAGKKLTEFQEYAIKDRFDEYVDKGWIEHKVSEEVTPVAIEEKLKAVKNVENIIEEEKGAIISKTSQKEYRENLEKLEKNELKEAHIADIPDYALKQKDVPKQIFIDKKAVKKIEEAHGIKVDENFIDNLNSADSIIFSNKDAKIINFLKKMPDGKSLVVATRRFNNHFVVTGFNVRDSKYIESIKTRGEVVERAERAPDSSIARPVGRLPAGLSGVSSKPSISQKYKAMQARIDEIKKTKISLKEQKSQMKEVLDYFKSERSQYKNRVKKYKDGKLAEEYNELPSYYRGKNGATLDELAGEIGVSGDMAARDFLINLESNYNKLKQDISQVNEQIQEQNKKEVISEISSLKRRLTDYRAGQYKAVKDLKALRDKVKKSAMAILPLEVRGKAISAINNIKNETDVKKGLQRIGEIYEDYLQRTLKAKAIKQILKKYKQPENVLDIDYQNKIKDTLQKYGETRADAKKELKKLSTFDLVELAKKVTDLIEKGKLTLAKKKELKKMAAEIMRAATIKAAGGEVNVEYVGSLEDNKKKKTSWISKVDLFFIDPIRLTRKLFGKFGEKMFFDSYDTAEMMARTATIKRIKTIEKAFKDNKIKTSDLGESVTIEGATFQINQILTMYAQKNNPEARSALINGNKITEDTLNKFTDWLESNKPNYVKMVKNVKVIVGEKYDELRDRTKEAYNVDLGKVEDYFPMRREGYNYDETNDSLMSMDIIGDAVMKKGHGVDFVAVEKGFTITRQQIADRNQLPLDLDFMGGAMKAIDNQEHFINFVPIQKMYNSIKSDLAVKASVVYNHGEAAWNAFNEQMNLMINPKANYRTLDPISAAVKNVRLGLTSYYLGFNAVTAMKQIPSSHLALKYTRIDYLYKSLAKATSSVFNKRLEEKVFALDPSLEARIVSRSLDELLSKAGKISDKAMIRKLKEAEQAIGKAAFSWILNMDRFAVIAVYDSVYEYQRRRVSEKEAKDIAHKAVIETQPPGSRAHQGLAYKTNNEFLKATLMFTSQLNKIYNMMRFDLPAELKGKEYKKAIAGITSIMLSSFLIYMASHGGKWPEDEEEQGKAFFDAFLGTFVSSVPILGNILMSALRGYSPSISPLQSMIDTGKYISYKFKNDKEIEAIIDSVIMASILTGIKIPLNAFKRTLRGITDLYEGKSEDFRRLIWGKSALFE